MNNNNNNNMEDSLVGPTAPTPKTPSPTNPTVGEMYEQQQQQQQQHHRHIHSVNPEKDVVSESQEFEDMIENDKIARRDTFARRSTDYMLRLIPATILVLVPIFLLVSGFYSPHWFYGFCVLFFMYNLYILGHNFYYGMIGLRRAKRSRFVNFYQKYLNLQRSGVGSSNSFKSKTTSSYGSSSSRASKDGEFISSSSDEELQYQQTRFKRMRQTRQAQCREDDVWNNVTHFVIIPNFNERESIMRQSLNSLAQQSMARRQIIPVLAMEAREVNVEQKAKKLVSDYILQFKDVLYTIHPAGLPGETPGKGSNSNYAWRYGVKEYIDQRSVSEIDPNYVVVTVQDADSIYHENHFDSLTYAFLASHMYGSNNLSIWQSPMVCYRNFNEIPAFSRMISFVVTLHELAALNDKNFEKISFSTYSMSHHFLIANNGWCPKYITEDWHCTVRTFFNSGGKAKVYSLPFPISCYSTQGETYYESMYERYVQGKRHALAFTEVPYILKRMILSYINNCSIPDYVKSRFHMFESKCTEGSAEEYEDEQQMIQSKPSLSRMLKMCWNVTSVQFIGGIQLTMIIVCFLFSQYWAWIYRNAEMTDTVYWVNHWWVPLYNLVNVSLGVVIFCNMYMNGELIALVNGREYQHKYYWIVHFFEWWIFSFPGTLLFNMIPAYIAAFRVCFEERFFFERSIKPEAPHIYRKKKAAATRKSRRISTGSLQSIASSAVATSGVESNGDEYVIDITSVASSTPNSRKKKKTPPKLTAIEPVPTYEGTSHSRSNSDSSLSVSNSCSEDEKSNDVLSDSSLDPLSPLSATGNGMSNGTNLFKAAVGTGDQPSNVVTHLTSATTTSRSKNLKVEVVVAVR